MIGDAIAKRKTIKLTKIRKQRYEALIDALVVASNLRFLQQLDVGYGDYIKSAISG